MGSQMDGSHVALELEHVPLVPKQGEGQGTAFSKARNNRSYVAVLAVVIGVVILLPLLIVIGVSSSRRQQKADSYTQIAPSVRTLYEGLPAAPGMHAVDSSQYVFTSSPANCPFILSVPHGGLFNLTGVPVRVGGFGEGDDRTMLLGVTVFDEIQQLTKGHCVPCIVALNVKRAWVDANRGVPYYNESWAYDQPAGKVAWTQYQDQGRLPLVVDIHGNSVPVLYGTVYPGSGTVEGSTLPSLAGHQPPYPDVWFDREDGLFNLLGRQGVPVFRNQSLLNGTTPLNGGYIIRHMGFNESVDSVQLEFSFAFRSSVAKARETGAKVAAALVEFARTGWPPEEDDKK